MPRYLPEEARDGATMLCVHNMRRAPLEPTTLYMQFHGGVYRSDDGGTSWQRINSINPRPMYFSEVRVDPTNDKQLYVLGIKFTRRPTALASVPQVNRVGVLIV